VTLDWHLIVNQGGSGDLRHPSYSVAQPITEFYPSNVALRHITHLDNMGLLKIVKEVAVTTIVVVAISTAFAPLWMLANNLDE